MIKYIKIHQLFIVLVFVWMWCSCGQSNSQNTNNGSNNTQNTNNEQSNMSTTYDDEPEGMEWGDPDEEPESQGISFYIKYVGNKSEKYADCKDFYMFLTTTDNKQFYLYDDEANYGGYALYSYIVFRSIFNSVNSTETTVVDKNIKNISPWLDCIMDLPNIETLPKEMKKYLLKLWYDLKEKNIYVGKRGYGHQSYKVGETDVWAFGSMAGTKEGHIRFYRYEKKAGDGFDEIPDESIMIKYVVVNDLLSI